MGKINRTDKKSQDLVFLIGILAFQAIILAMIFLSVPNTQKIHMKENETPLPIEKLVPAEGTLPNITRPGYPLILNNESAEQLWLDLHGRHVNNIRVAYYSLENEWVLIPFQLDEMAYLRSYKYEIGFQADASLSFLSPRVDDVDLCNWAHTTTEHRYVGLHLNETTAAGYQEPTLYEAEMSYWWERQLENYVGGDTPPDPPVHDPLEDPGQPKEQLPHRLDWDDELCFYAENGKKASRYSWWNYDQYPQRYEIKINDPVDGGQSWMYIYYNDVDMQNPPDYNYYIPPGGSDLISWDKANLKITGQTYELQLDTSNLDLDSALKIKWPGLTANDLYTNTNKQYLSMWFRVYYSASGVTIDENDDTEVWREGQWDEGYYDEQLSDIGYGMPIDLGWNDGGSDWSGHRTRDDPGVSSTIYHTLPDDGDSVLGQVVSEADAADHDGDTSEITPHIRGILTPGQKNGLSPNMPSYIGSHEAAIDGPCRVILDRVSIQYIFVSMPSPIEWEELWTIATKRSKYYANMYQDDPYVLDLDMNDPDSDLTLTIHPHYSFMFTQRFSDFVRNDPDSYVLLGSAPNSPTDGLPDFAQQASSGTKSWPLYVYPDGAQNGAKGNDGILSGGNPSTGHFDDTHLLPGSGMGLGSNPPADNPLSDWTYLYTSSGGAWSYVPYQEWWQLFTTEPNRDLATYWKDTADPGGYSEIGLYGNDADYNGATGEYIMRTVFGNFSYWECLREYARMKYRLNDNLEVNTQTPPPTGAPIFEDTEVTTGYWYDDGDTIEIIIDMDGDYDETTEISADFSYISVNPSTTITEINSVLHKYKISHVIDATGISDRTPPLSGYPVNITVTNTTANPDVEGWTIEELYLDKTDPTPPSSLTATQVGATVEVSWSGQSDNGEIDHYEIWRSVDSGSYSKMIDLDAPASSWVDDNNILNSKNYSYYVLPVDMVGHVSAIGARDWVIIDLSFDPAIPDPLNPYHTSNILINWTSNPGDTGVIDNYRVHWARKAVESPPPSSGDYTPVGGYLPNTQKTYTFTPTDGNGYYFFKVESYDSGGGGVSIYSGEVHTLYDIENPIAGVIEDIPDDYYPEFAEIHVHWSSEFDAWSGIDKFELYRQDNGGGYGLIDTFSSTEHDYYDTSLTDGHTYDYYIRTYDKAGNYDNTAVESVTYHAPSNPPANLKLSSVVITPVASQRNSNFNVDVTVSNTGGSSGTVNDIDLTFYLPGEGDLTYNFSWTDDSYGSVSQYSSITYTLTSVSSTPFTLQGEFTVDATLQWDTSNYDYDADTTDTIWIRDFSVVNIFVDAPAVVQNDSVNNIIYLDIVNTMETQINITSAYLTFPTWTEGVHYTISDNFDVILPDGILNGGDSATITFVVDIDGSAPVGNGKPINAYVEGIEVITGTAIDNSSAPATTWNVVPPDNTPPTVSNTAASPDPGDPEAGDILLIYATVTDVSGVSSVTAYIEYPDETVITTLTLYDDGTHNDPTPGDNNYTNSWDCTGQSVGTYFIDIRAVDSSPDSNVQNQNNAGTFTLEDQTAPSVGTVSATPDPLELESTLTITAQVTDFSGVSSVTAYIQHPNEILVQTLTLYDDGPGGGHGDATAGDDIYTNQWTTISSNALGNYFIDIRAVDSSPNSNTINTEDSDTFVLRDTTSPSLSSATITPDSGQPGQSFVINVNAIDPSGVTSVWASIQQPDNVLIESVQLFDDGAHNDGIAGDDTYGGTWSSTGYGEGTFYVDINATDGSTVPSANTGWLYNIDNDITITDTNGPTIQNSQANPANGDPEQGAVFTITSQVTDVSGVLEVWATIEDGSWVAGIQLFDDGPSGGHGDAVASDNIYTNQWDSSGTAEGIYNVDINATDNSIAQNTATDNNIDTIQLIDATSPNVISVDASPPNGDPEAGTIFTITCNVVDLSGLSSVTAYIEHPDETNIATLTLYDDGTHGDITSNDDIFTNTWDSSGAAVGTYYVDISAVDGSAASNTRNINNGDTFTLADNTGPTIGTTNINTANLELGSVLTVSAVVTDFSGVAEVWATIEDGSWVAGIQLYDDGTHGDATPGDNNYTGQWDSSGYAIGSYNIDINATDNSANSNTNIANNAETFNIVDTTDPLIQSEQATPDSGTIGQTFDLFATVTDESGISEVWATIQNATNPYYVTIQLLDNGAGADVVAGDNIYSGQWSSTGSYAFTYNVDFNATDNNGRSSLSDNADTITLVTEDTIPPVIQNVLATPSTVNPGDTIRITCDIIDDSGIFTPNITLSNYSYRAVFDLILLSGNTWYYDWDTTGALGTYNISINATDKSTNRLNSFAENVTSCIVTNADIKNPSVFDIVDLSNQEVGYIYIIHCNVTDDQGVDKVYAYIQNPDGTNVDIVELTDPDIDGNYTGIWDSTGFAIGTYYLDINATDTSSNQNYTNNADIFNLDDTTNPTLIDSWINTTTLEFGQILLIMVNVSDASGIQSVWADIQETDGNTVASIQLNSVGNGNYSNTWNSLAYGLNASYFIDFRVIDASSNNNQGTFDNAQSFNLQDTTIPNISSETITSNPLELGNTQLISCAVTDLSGINEVWATLRVGGLWVAGFRLYDDGLHGDGISGDDTYANWWDSTGYVLATYSVDINATDLSNNPSPNSNQSLAFGTFILQDTVDPSITNTAISPDSGEPDTTFTITADVSDVSGISSVWATIESPNEVFYTGVQLYDDGSNGDATPGDGTYTYAWDSTGAPEGWYYVDVNATDNNGRNTEVTDIDANIYIGDTNGPSVSNVFMTPNTGDAENGTVFMIYALVSDPSGILAVTAYIEFPDETIIATITMYDDGSNGDLVDGDNNYTGSWNCIGRAEGTYWLDINATDNSIAQNQRLLNNQDSVSVEDLTKPEINEVLINPSSGDPEVGTIFIISVNTTDFSGLSQVIAFIEYPDETVITTLTLYDDGTHGDAIPGDYIFTNNWSSSGRGEGTYYVDIRAIDASLNLNTRNIDNSVSFILADNTDPLIQNSDISPNSGEVTQIFTITTDVSDAYGIISVYASITDSTTGTWIAGIQLYDDGAHSDGLGGDGQYGNTWDSTGYSIGSYNLSINATDGSVGANVAFDNNIETFSLTPPVPSISVTPIYLTEFGYIGVDKVILIFNISVTKADINIIDIYIRFGTAGIYNPYFNLEGLSISLAGGYILAVADGEVTIMINYTIDASAQTTEDIQPCHLIIVYEDLLSTSYPDQESLITTLNYINIYELPKVTNRYIDGIGAGGYVGKGNAGTVTFYAVANHFTGTYGYTVKLNLTELNKGIVDMVWSVDRYFYTIPTEIDNGIYDLSKISINVSITVPTIGYKENLTNYPGPTDPAIITVDIDDPLRNNYIIQVDTDDQGRYYVDINAKSDRGFWVIVNATDNETSGIFSGISKVEIYISTTQQWYTMSHLSGVLYGILISPSLIGNDPFIFYTNYDKSIEIGEIKVTDGAGNENPDSSATETIYLVDTTPMELDDIELNINGEKIDKAIELPAGEYLSIKIKVPYDNVGNTPIRWVRIYFKISGLENDISTQADNTEGDYTWIQMSALDDGYFAVISIPGQVGFKQGQELTFFIRISDYSGNEADSDKVEITFKEDPPIVSYIVLGIAVIGLLGALVYRIGFYRNKAKIIKFEDKLTTKKKK
ncbi:MAG: choice-of-anchor X domain-containing protein [Promethearchaeota archaeon]